MATAIDVTEFGRDDDDFTLPSEDPAVRPPDVDVVDDVEPPDDKDDEKDVPDEVHGTIAGVREFLKRVAITSWAKWTVFTFALCVFAISLSMLSIAGSASRYYTSYYSDDNPYKLAVTLCSLQFLAVAFAFLGLCLVGFGAIKKIEKSKRIWRMVKILFGVALFFNLILFAEPGLIPLSLPTFFLLLIISILSFEMTAICGDLRCACCDEGADDATERKNECEG